MPAEAIHFDHATVRHAFEKAGCFFDGAASINAALHAARRHEPGEAEIHRDEADLMVVQQGDADIVTGGLVSEPREIAPGEIRGPRIEGGRLHHLSPGDILVIPRGVPHWFKDVSGTFLYLVIKVR